MAWRPHGHVKVNARRPAAAGICDRCGRAVNHNTLRWQFDYSGLQFQNLRILVCALGCEDRPQRQLGAKTLTPDPVPIYNARPEPFTTTGFSYDETNVMVMPDPLVPFGTNVNGYEMQMPDGLTVMMEPANPPGVSPQ